MLKLSGVIITFNEELNIEKCLKSLANVVDEIIVVDSFSTDKTKSICKKYNVTFIEQKFLGYTEQKNFALSQTTHNHVVALDGDEALSEMLQKSIINLKTNWKFDGYYVNRFNNFCGQWIKHTTWYPEKKIRVFDKTKASWSGYKIHETVNLNSKDSKVGKLKGDILHRNYQSYSEHNQQIEKFTSISAQAYYDKGKKSSLFKIIVNPTWAFFQSYVIKLGFLDGFNGFYISVQTAHIRFLKYAKLRELNKKS
ncbi:glycosyltransferase family 2 protein [Winogradskyella wichelsiae]|uniref:glycosyltransferase family 2 protein n=1 Tax=Winogradskyella wichelsiae TaxID=2697007 RepID=UPI003EF9D3E0